MAHIETYYCSRCDAPKTRPDLWQVEADETCLYACRQCGAVEGLWLRTMTPTGQADEACR